jgi:hypothetical protein
MAEYVSGEEYQKTKNARQQPNRSSLPLNPIGLIIVALVVAGLSFYGGVAYQKGKHPSSAASAGAGLNGGRFGGRTGGQRPDIGQVTAVSPTSITVQNSRTGTSSTLSITSSTQITDNGQTVTVSDIQTGSTVLAVASTSDSSQAARIMVNPSFGGGGSGAAAPTTTTN